MNITANFKVTKDQIKLEIPEKNLYLSNPNVILFDIQLNQPLAIGEYADVIRSRVLEKDFPPNLKIGKSFQNDDEDAANLDLMIIEYYLAFLYYSKQISPIPLEMVNYNFDILNYEKWGKLRQDNFIYSLQFNDRVKTLVINGVTKHISINIRRFEKIVRVFFANLVPFALFIFALTKITTLFEILFLIIGLPLSILMGYIFWILIVSNFLPKSYILFIVSRIKSIRFKNLLHNLVERLLINNIG